MSNRLFQGVVHQMWEAAGRNIGVIDETMTIIACSDLTRVGEAVGTITSDAFTTQDAVAVDGCTYKAFGSRPHCEYVLFVEGDDEEAARYAALLAVSLQNIKQYYDEKYDRSNFVKNVILDNILPGDIYLKARELRFNSDVSRAVLLIRITNATDISAFDVIQNLFPDKAKDFVVNINKTDMSVCADHLTAADNVPNVVTALERQIVKQHGAF